MTRRRMMSRAATLLCVGALAGTSMIGCGHGRWNTTPGISSLSVSKQRDWNRAAVTNDTNLRALVRDFTGPLWMMDRPSRLHPLPSPY